MKLNEKKSILLSETIYYNTNKKSDFRRFVREITWIKNYTQGTSQTLLFLCIGSDRATGDCLGPLVGEMLQNTFAAKQCKTSPIIYGSLKQPVHAVNLSQTMENIQKQYKNPFVIAIDASLGIKEHVGYITLGGGPLYPGIGVKKNLPKVGNSAITGIVNLSGNQNNLTLQTTRLSTVLELSTFIAAAIAKAYHLEVSHINSSFECTI